jgi:hypothetical protein
MAGKGRITGLVLFDDKPVPGIRVRLCADVQFIGGCNGSISETKTDVEGRYRFIDIPVGDYTVAVSLFSSARVLSPADGLLQARKYKVTAGAETQVKPVPLFKQDLKWQSPRSGATVNSSRPLLEWQTYPGASRYEVSLGTDSRTFHASETLETAETRVQPGSALVNGPYVIFVQAFNAKGVKLAEMPTSVKFKVAGQVDPPPPPKLKSPLGNDIPRVGDKVRFEWSAVPGATTYDVHLMRKPGKGEPRFDKQLTVSGTSLDWELALPSGSYSWIVWASNGKNLLSSSELGAFRVR